MYFRRMIRTVTLEDAEAIVAMYNYYIRTSIVTFEEVELTTAVMRDRIEEIAFQKGFPYLVLEENGEILGYAYARTFRERFAYRFTVESSVYVHPDHFGNGIGKALYAELLAILGKGNYHRVIGGITLPNEASVQLHEHFGFRKVAHFTEVGYKFEQWLDVGFWELDLPKA